MKYPFVFNSSESCYIMPRMPNYPNGTYLDFNTCPERYDNTTQKLVRFCCFNIIINVLENSNYRKIQDWLTYNSSSLLVLPAIFFNLLSLLVLTRFSRLSASATSTHFYMQCLCVFDTMTILSKFMHEVIVVRNTIRDVPFVFGSSLCKFSHFSESIFAITSIYILIAMSFDKLICVALPLKVGSLLTPKKARFICAFIVLFAAMYSSHHIFNQKVYIISSPLENSATSVQQSPSVSSLSNDTDGNVNGTAMAKRVIYECADGWRALAEQMKLIDNIIRVFVPILLLCICNLSIAIVLARARRNTLVMLSECSTETTVTRDSRKIYLNKKKNNKNKTQTKNEEILLRNLINKIPNDEIMNADSDTVDEQSRGLRKFLKIFFCCNKKPAINNNRETSIHHRKAKQNSHYISIMLFAVCFGFVLLNLPFALKTLFERQFKEKNEILNYIYNKIYQPTTITKSDIISAVKYDFIVYITHFLLDLNYIANFFLYFLSGSRFRSQLFALIRCEGACSQKGYLHTVDNTNAGNQHKLLHDRRSVSTLATRAQSVYKNGYKI